jgi:hypothetical protein
MFLLTINLLSIPFYHPCTQAGWLQFIYYVRMVGVLHIYKIGLGGLNQSTLHKLCFYSPWDDRPQEQGGPRRRFGQGRPETEIPLAGEQVSR